MSEILVLRLEPGHDNAASWLAIDANGTRRGNPGRGSLTDAAAEAGERPVVVLVPGTDVLTTVVDIPARGARLAAALPFALEDQLADDVDRLHFAAGKRRDDGRLPVSVVSRDRLDGWLSRLRAAGIAPARVVPENHGLAIVPNTLSMLVTGDGVMFNDGGDTAFVLPDIAPADALAATGILESASEDGGSPRHLLAYCDAALGDRYERDWALLRHELDGVDVRLLPDGALPRLAVTIASGAGINLLQGPYGEKRQLGGWLHPWRYAAALLLGLAVVGLASKVTDYVQLRAEQASLEAQFTAEYRRLRPADQRNIADPVGTVNSLRRSRGATTEGPQVFLPSLASLADAVARTDAVSVEAISYRAGVVDVRLSAPDIPSLDRVVQAIDASGRFTASLQSADNVGDRVSSRIQIKEAG